MSQRINQLFNSDSPTAIPIGLALASLLSKALQVDGSVPDVSLEEIAKVHPERNYPRHPLLKCGAVVLSALQVLAVVPQTAFAQEHDSKVRGTSDPSSNTATPIKHVIVIIGENRTFDHVFATYKPKKGESVSNLLSKEIINEDGTPGPNYSLAAQSSAVDTNADGWEISPTNKSLYSKLPTPLAGGPTTPFIPSLAIAKAVENGLCTCTW